ncbi:MAG: 30S ribosomal protein S12 methylthiotransferase RimO [Acidobacteria bacterium]|nr:30S ribosomal protein S12 methylthiotransferase RimO [Acidobacteriota bacterium]
MIEQEWIALSTPAARTIGFVSLGCPKNLVDSEVMMGLVAERGYHLTADRAEAEIIVVNTCAFIGPAKEESIDTILEMAELKKRGRCRRLIVTGCLVERYRETLLNEMPEIDAVLGTNEVADILRACGELDRLHPAEPHYGAYLYDHATPRVLATPRFSAYVKIAEGCDHSCSFCIIPKLRGAFRSRSIDSILTEARSLADRGIREIVLISQDTTHYGEDLGLRDALPSLLRQLAGVDGLAWIRFLYGYPNHVSDRLIDVVAEEAKVCSYFDIPFQHATTRMLQIMRRGGSQSSLADLVGRIRTRSPGAAIRTTFVVGHPGETEADFDEMVAFVREMEFDRLGVFEYSDEEDTRSFVLEGKVGRRIATSRRKRLLREQERISLKKNSALIGRKLQTLLEGFSSETDLLLEGRLETQAPEIDGRVLINETPEDRVLQAGEFLDVEITRALPHDLIGRVV